MIRDGKPSFRTPAYDLTFSPGPGGGHITTVLGEGRQPELESGLKLAAQAGLKSRASRRIIHSVNAASARGKT